MPRVCFLAGLLLVVAGARWGLAVAVAAELRVGTAMVNIDPPMAIPLAGYYSERGSQGVADDLFAKAAVLDDGQTRVALVVCDLIGVPRQVAVEARKLGLVDGDVTVHCPGGNLQIKIGADFSIRMTGGVTRVSEGVISPEIFS